jgi:phage terminase large subunit-like protein
VDVRKWRGSGPDSAEGFFNFLADVQPMVKDDNGRYTPFQLRPREVAEITAALNGTAAGPYRTIVFCWPRRHGKTITSALIIIWRYLTRQNQEIAIVANSKTQTLSTAFSLITGTLTHTPYLKKLVDSGAIVIQGEKIIYKAMGNLIQGYTANAAALYGKKLAIAQVSELHAAALAV